MFTSQSKDESTSDEKTDTKKDYENPGKEYEKLVLMLLAKKICELSKDSQISNFFIGREVNVGEDDSKLGDIVFKYEDQNNSKNFSFVQIKHKKDDSLKINSNILTQAEGSGRMSKDFNLRQYFTSYLKIKEALISNSVSNELKNGVIKYVVLFTNIDLDIEDLNDKAKGFSVKEASDDIEKLFTLRRSSSRTLDNYKHCYQLNNVNNNLQSVFKKCCDLHRLARELAQYAVSEKYSNYIIRIDKGSIKYYHIALEKEVIKKSNVLQNRQLKKPKINTDLYCLAHFRDEFIDNDEDGPKKQLLEAILEAMREIKSNDSISDTDLKKELKDAKLKVVQGFGEGKSGMLKIPDKWMQVDEADITDFLNCLVFSVKQPNRRDFLIQITSEKENFFQGTQLGKILDKMDTNFKDRLEKVLGIFKTTPREEKWISGNQIINFIQELQYAVIATMWTIKYELKVMQYGSFNTLGKLEASLDSFLKYGGRDETSINPSKEKRRKKEEKLKKKKLHLESKQILCISTVTTVLSAVKILQYLKIKTQRSENGYISLELCDLKYSTLCDCVEAAFRSESLSLLIVDCLDEQKMKWEEEIKELYYRFYNVIKDNPSKKIILIINQSKIQFLTDLKKVLENDCDPRNLCVEEIDDIIVTNFKPCENPLQKKVILFQGKEISLAALTGILDWNNYISTSSQDQIQNKLIIDPLTLLEILKNNCILIGCKPLGTDSLEGSYVSLFEEINVETFTNKLLNNKNDYNTSDMYIISNISGLNKNEKVTKLVGYLRLTNKKKDVEKQTGDSDSDSRIKVIDNKFKEKDFKDICHKYPEKEIFWICVRNEKKFILQMYYDPNFYFKRKFKKVIIKKEVKSLLIDQNLSEIFIFSHVNDLIKLMELLCLTNGTEKEEFKNNYKNSTIKSFTSGEDAKIVFEELCKENKSVHWLKFEEDQLILYNSHGVVNNLQKYIDHDSKMCLFEEDNLAKEIRNRKVVIIADDPGMGKTTSLTKLYESGGQDSFIATHWIISVILRDNLQAIRNMEITNGKIDVINFLAEIDQMLNNNLAKNLLEIALDKNEDFLKPLLLVFDGFDEVLDVKDRIKIFDLLRVLKETSAKVWITTRLHYKEALEKELATFAIEFVPMDDKVKEVYIKKYLKDHLHLILSKEKFAEIFNEDEMHENAISPSLNPKGIHNYTKEFLNEMKLIFKDNSFRFIGTPLQLYLMLEGSINHFKNWIQNQNQNLNFSNFAQDLWEVYEKFIDRKYDIYFQKASIIEHAWQNCKKITIDEFHENLAISSIPGLKQKPKYDQFKEIVLSIGIAKSEGSRIEFIHTNFKYFYAAKVFVHWMTEEPITPFNSFQHEFILKEIFKKPDYKLIRTFMNLKLKKIAKTELLEKSIRQYGEIIKKVFEEELDDMRKVAELKLTALHIAAIESNTYIVHFLLNSLKGHINVLKDFLFSLVESSETALHFACETNNDNIVGAILDAAAACSEDALQKILYKLDVHGSNALDNAAMRSNNIKIFEMLLTRANNKLDLIVNKKKKCNTLCLAVRSRKENFIKLIIDHFKGDENALKLLLLTKRESGNVLHYAVANFFILESQYVDTALHIIEYLLSTAKSINDDNETLKKLLLAECKSGELPLSLAVGCGNIYLVEILLDTAELLVDDCFTLKKMLSNCFIPAFIADEHCHVGELLLEIAFQIDGKIFEKLFFGIIEKNKNAIKVTNENGQDAVFLNFTPIFKENKHHSVKKKFIELYNSLSLSNKFRLQAFALRNAIDRNDISKVKDILDHAKYSDVNAEKKLEILLLAVDREGFKCNTLHTACLQGYTDIIRELIFYAASINDNGEILKKLITSYTCWGVTPFQLIKEGYISEIKQIIENLIQTKNDNDPVAIILKEYPIYKEKN